MPAGHAITSAETPTRRVFAQLVLAQMIEPASKLDSLRVLEEADVDAPSYATLKRLLPTLCGAVVVVQTVRGLSACGVLRSHAARLHLATAIFRHFG